MSLRLRLAKIQVKVSLNTSYCMSINCRIQVTEPILYGQELQNVHRVNLKISKSPRYIYFKD